MFFLFLLLLNALFAGWLYFQPEKTSVGIQPLPAQLKTLVLLSETELPSLEIIEKGEPVSAEDSVKTEVEKISQPVKQTACYTLGPFTDQAQVQSIQEEIAAFVSNSKLRKRVENELHRYWIYFPATETRGEAIETSKSLARNKVKDYYIVHGGDHNNRISLGHFKEKLHADRRFAQLQKLGYFPEMQPIYREYEVYWLDYSAPQQQGDNDPVSAYIGDEVSRLSRDCE